MEKQLQIYSFKVRYGNGSGNASGRIAGHDFQEAKQTLLNRFAGYGELNVNMTLLKNQKRALEIWKQNQERLDQKD